MASQFYARYVPSATTHTSVKDVDDIEHARPAKKRRKKDDHTIKDTNTLRAINSNQSLISERKDSTSELNEAAKITRPSNQPANGIPNSNKNQRLISQKPDQQTIVEKFTPERDRKSLHVGRETESSKPDVNANSDQAQPSANLVKIRKKKKRPRDLESESNLNLVAEVPSEGSKHLNILSKYKKSVDVAAKSARNGSHRENAQDIVATSSKIHGLTPIPQSPQLFDAAPMSNFSTLPGWLQKPVVASGVEPVSFDGLPMHPSIRSSLKAKGFTQAFTIQSVVLPLLLQGEFQHDGDLCISASTGSGKTFAYTIPIIEALREKPITRLRGLIIVPTRELVSQVREVLELCSTDSGLKIGTACGSKNLREEQDTLILRQQRYNPNAYQQEQHKDIDEDEEVMNWDIESVEEQDLAEDLVDYVDEYSSKVDILVCTPGRLIEHLQHTRGFVLDHVQWFVVDEADRLLDESYQKWIDIVVSALEYQNLPSSLESQMMQRYHLLRKREIRKIILSATISRDISKLNELKLRRPKLVVFHSEHLPKQMDNGIVEQTPKPEQSMQIQLPLTLQEISIQIRDEENKPLYLIELLKQLPVNDSQTPDKYTSINTNGRRGGSTSDHNSLSSESISSSSVSSSVTTSAGSESEATSDRYETEVQRSLSRPRVRGSLVFAHSTSSAHRLSRLLSMLSPEQASAAATLTKSSAKLSRRILSQFGSGKLNTIISTDRASRGLDIPGLAHVINYDMPPSANSYIHRVGRTARAGRVGKAITLVGWKEGRWFWNEIGRGQGIQRGDRKITRQTLKEAGWDAGELEQYAESLKQLGEETRAG
ncbi:MAG: hypothetical protein L6R41_001645 [Letrouitia leprolyta]|nr:MAG: hypothetical protein L6R41_001645 [Letrouitia leprolyta]